MKRFAQLPSLVLGALACLLLVCVLGADDAAGPQYYPNFHAAANQGGDDLSIVNYPEQRLYVYRRDGTRLQYVLVGSFDLTQAGRQTITSDLVGAVRSR